MWADVTELVDALCIDTVGWYDVVGEPTDWTVGGGNDGAAEGG